MLALVAYSGKPGGNWTDCSRSESIYRQMIQMRTFQKKFHKDSQRALRSSKKPGNPMGVWDRSSRCICFCRADFGR